MKSQNEKRKSKQILDKNEVFDAIKLGVKEAFLEILESGGGFKLNINSILEESIDSGVYSAIWEAFSRATRNKDYQKE